MPRYLLLPFLLTWLVGCAFSPQQSSPPAGGVAGVRPSVTPRHILAPVQVTAERIKANEQLLKTTIENGPDTVKSAFTTTTNTPAPVVTRLESSWTRQLNEGTSRLRVGDTISLPGGGGTPLRFGGVQFGSSLDLRDDIIASSRLAMPGVAVLPSSVDALLSTGNSPDSPMGRQGLVLDGKVQLEGANRVKIATRDALGRTVQVTQPLMSGIRLTAPGCGAYAVDLGKVRRDYALKSNVYGDWYADARVECGIPLGLTIEGHGEFLGNQGGLLGIGLARDLSAWGKASIGLASSQDTTSSGWLARMGFDHSNRLFDLNVRTTVQTPGFQRMGVAPSTDPALRSTIASLGVHAGDSGSLAVVYATETTLADVTEALVALTQRMRFGAFTSLTMTAGQSLAATARAMSVYLSFTRTFGSRPQQSSTLPDSINLIRLPRRVSE